MSDLVLVVMLQGLCAALFDCDTFLGCQANMQPIRTYMLVNYRSNKIQVSLHPMSSTHQRNLYFLSDCNILTLFN
jgi:hypothetical protein